MKKILIPLLTAVITFCTVFFGWADVVGKNAEDILYHHPGGTIDKIKIIKIDDKSINALGDYDDWGRGIYADLVEALCVSEDVRPAVIGFDVLFDGGGDSGQDKRFADVCAENGNVVCAVSYVFEREVTADSSGRLLVDNMAVSSVIEPYPALYAATRHGFANALMDSDDGIIRSSFLRYPVHPTPGDKQEFSFNAEVYRAYADQTGAETRFPGDMEDVAFSFLYSGGAGDYENVSLCDVLDGSISPQAFDDCIVLVGAYTVGMMDAYYVPVDKSQQMFGVEIHANAIQALIEEKYLFDFPRIADALLCAAAAAIISFFCGRLTVAKGVILCAGSAVAKLAIGYILFSGLITGAGYRTDVVTLPAMLMLTAGFYTAAHYYKARMAKNEIENAFKKYVAPQVVEEIAKSGRYVLELGGEVRDIACLFVDIRGFTPLSESLGPKQVVKVLNSYLELTSGCIFKYGGTLDKFVGDATMAVFGAPFDLEDHIFKAVLTAWDIVQGSEKIDRECMELCGRHVGFGVGVNCGPAVVGNIGCNFRMDYTAIGDTVNTAARLEANAPQGMVYISDKVYEAVKDRVTVEEIGEIPLKGKSKGVFVYSLTGVKDGADIPGKEAGKRQTAVEP